MSFEKIAVLGLGKVGKLAAKLLHDSGFDVTSYDIKTPREKLSFAVKNTDLTSLSALAAEFIQVEAVLSCLP
ncbi:MAG: L-lysine dehydrogenase, partial [Gammaproteobacteria bacterium]|nr:L-lysine dehydrogenase [Gammaproteobacteria bacterium]